jgi:hypothetical protein
MLVNHVNHGAEPAEVGVREGKDDTVQAATSGSFSSSINGPEAHAHRAAWRHSLRSIWIWDKPRQDSGKLTISDIVGTNAEKIGPGWVQPRR